MLLRLHIVHRLNSPSLSASLDLDSQEELCKKTCLACPINQTRVRIGFSIREGQTHEESMVAAHPDIRIPKPVN